LPEYAVKWGVNLLTFESDTEPYALSRDQKITELFESSLKISTYATHTIHDMQKYVDASGGITLIPGTYASFCKLFESFGRPRCPVRSPTATDFSHSPLSTEELCDPQYNVPTLLEMGYTQKPTKLIPGGETEALRRLRERVSDRPDWTVQFEKPHTPPNSLEPSTTVSRAAFSTDNL
jgi:cryptochrome